MKKEPTAPPLYPDLSEVQEQSTQDEGINFRLKRISDIRDSLEKEFESRGRLRRRYKSLYNTAYYTNIASSLTAIASSTAAAISITTVIGALAALPLGIIAISTGAIGIVSSKISQIFLKKCEKHDRIKLIAMSKLSSVNSLVSTALTDGRISDEEFRIIMQEMESYRV